MMNLLDSMKAGYAGFVDDGQYLMLFMVALLLLWITDDNNQKEFGKLCFTMLIVLIFPITAKILMIYQTAFYNYEDLWELLPVTALISYGLVMSYVKMMTALKKEYGRRKTIAPKRKELVYEVLICLVLSAVLFLCGTLSPGKTMTKEVMGPERIPVQTTDVLDLIEISGQEQVILLAPDEVMTWARIYNGHIMLPYGRDLIEPELTAYTYDYYGEDMWQLHEWVNGTLPACEDLQEAVWQEEMYVSLCASNAYDYVVFSTERHNEVLIKALEQQKEYVLTDETENYVIYKLQ